MKGGTNNTATKETCGYVNVTGKLKSLFNKLFKNRGEKKVIDNKQLVEYIEIEGTPFTAVKEGGSWFLVMGRYRLTEALTSKEEAIKEGANQTWWRIMQVVKIMIEDHEKNKDKDKEELKEAR